MENGLFFALGGQGGFIYKGGLGVDYETIFPKVYEGGNGSGTSIDVISAEDAWAAFNWGQMFHWDGTQWTSVELPLASPGYTNFYEIEFSDENNGWVVGKGPSELNGPANSLILLHWDGKQWSDVTEQLLETYPDLSVDQEELEFPLETVSSKSVWLGSGDHILHWDGSTWNRISTPEGMQGIVSIAVLDDKYVWALSHTIQKTGDGEKIDEAIFTWDGNEWKKSQIQLFPRDFRYSGKLLVISMDNVWLASKGLFHWNGKEWEDMAYDGRYGPVMDMDTDGRVWALTETGIILELKYPE